MKLVKILIVALGLMAIAATASFAAVQFTSSSTLNQMAPNAQTGLAGSITLAVPAGFTGTIPAGEIIQVTYGGAQISSLSDLVISMVTATGTATGSTGVAGTVAAYGTAYPVTGIAGPPTATVNNASILIAFPAAVNFAAGDNIQISGVRLNVSGFATPGNTLNASISSVLGQATVTNPSVPVAIFVEPITILATPIVQATFSTAGTVVTTGTATVRIRELFTNAFETKGAIAPTQLILRISSIPTGLNLVGVAVNAATSATVTAVVPAPPNPVIAVSQVGATGTAVIQITAQDATQLETIVADLTFAPTPNTTLPLSTTANPGATVAATLGPPASATQLANVAGNIAPIPVGTANNPIRYANRFVDERLILTVTQLVTELLSVFNSWVPGSFDTGFAIANTTGFNTGYGNIVGQPGNVIAILYPANGDAAKTVTTSATVFGGTGGLNANGEIPAHATWTVLLSQLAAQAGFTTGFTGQVFFRVNASNAHGINYISDSQFKVQAQGYPMLVLSSPIIPRIPGPPESLGN